MDAAVELRDRGHDVTIFTSHYDPSHCFEETKSLKIVTLGNTIVPTSIGNKFFIVCSILRQLHLSFRLLKDYDRDHFDIFIIDQLSACIPVLRQYTPTRVLFYCHFPDQLLAQHQSVLRKLYRLPFDKFEEWTTGLADTIVVNSKFTRSVFENTFPALKAITPEVLYPCVDTAQHDNEQNQDGIPDAYRPYILSINRFERKKNIELAILSYALVDCVNKPRALIIAGGYDLRVKENVEYLKYLRELCIKLGLATALQFPSDKLQIPTDEKLKDQTRSLVIFLPSVDSKRKNALLSNADLLLYTPSNEHFGIVPLEAMAAGTPVLATNTGGPLETVVNNETGWTVPAKPEQWASCIKARSVMNDSDKKSMSSKARKQAERFSRTEMGSQFEQCIERTLAVTHRREPGLESFLLWFKAAVVVLIVACIARYV